VRPDARPELRHELRVGAELGIGALGQLPEVGRSIPYPFVYYAVDLLCEVEGSGEEIEGLLSLHGWVVGCEEVLRA
jgi:hypothetical protein